MFKFDAPKQCLQNRIILITGAADGIGRVAAKTFAEAGATVILLGRTLSKLESLYDEITAAGAAEPVIAHFDLAQVNEENCAELADSLAEQYGALDGLLHNASILGTRTSLALYDPSIWRNLMQVNVDAAFLLTQALLPSLEQAKNASIIFTSSGVGQKGKAYWGAYSVSKFATEALMQIWADELANTSTIRVNAINPGATRTQMRASAYPAENPDTNPTPEQIMAVYLYLMSDASLDVNGQLLDAQ